MLQCFTLGLLNFYCKEIAYESSSRLTIWWVSDVIIQQDVIWLFYLVMAIPAVPVAIINRQSWVIKWVYTHSLSLSKVSPVSNFPHMSISPHLLATLPPALWGRKQAQTVQLSWSRKPQPFHPLPATAALPILHSKPPATLCWATSADLCYLLAPTAAEVSLACLLGQSGLAFGCRKKRRRSQEQPLSWGVSESLSALYSRNFCKRAFWVWLRGCFCFLSPHSWNQAPTQPWCQARYIRSSMGGRRWWKSPGVAEHRVPRGQMNVHGRKWWGSWSPWSSVWAGCQALDICCNNFGHKL